MKYTEQTNRPSWFFWFIAFYAAVQMIWFGPLIFDFVTHPIASDTVFGSPILRLAIGLIVVPLALGVSGLVLRRAPYNVTGLCLLLFTATLMGETLRASSPLVAYGSSSGWTGIWLLPFCFPDGRVFPRRLDRWIRLGYVLLVIIELIWPFIHPSLSVNDPQRQQLTTLANPLFIPALLPLQPLVETLESVCLVLTGLLIVPALVLRYRQSDIFVRQQMKWLVWGFMTLVAAGLVLVPTQLMTDAYRYGPVGMLAFFAFTIFVDLLPYIAVGNAILRHRLYDIDIIIRRTLIYSILTGVLATIYFGGVVLLQRLFQAAVGQTPDVAIVISTLLIAALFSPIRRRVQATIDRRFYRRKYDAEKTLARFNQTLRDEVDIETLKDSLVGVVQETMQPTRVSLWLRELPPSMPLEREK